MRLKLGVFIVTEQLDNLASEHARFDEDYIRKVRHWRMHVNGVGTLAFKTRSSIQASTTNLDTADCQRSPRRF
jgi:hypothetical protein